MSKIALIGISLVCLSVAASGNRQAAGQRTPSDADQLVIVRLTAALNDAFARRDRAQLEYGRALRDVQDLEPELQKAIEAAKAKLPPPAAGTQWSAQTDGQLGVKFVEIPTPQPPKATQDKGASEPTPNLEPKAPEPKKGR